MADGLHADDSYGHARKILEKSLVEIGENASGRGHATSDRQFVNFTQQNGHHTLEDCRKKRCVDRYDSSESSDSGVAVLSCTDCSGSSTASSDITDPGSPFSTASNHSEDSGVAAPPLHHQPPPRMPPAQTAHHPPWLWTEAAVKLPPTRKLAAKMQQGKITEYFKTQLKHSLRKDWTKPKPGIGGKIAIIQNQKSSDSRRAAAPKLMKTRKLAAVTAPRKILPAPSKIPQPDRHVTNNLYQFGPVIAAPVAFPSNVTYLHAKSQKPPHDNLFLPQFATLNCVKLNAIVVPSRLLSVDTALPTVPAARPKLTDVNGFLSTSTVAQTQTRSADGGAPFTRTDECQSKPEKPPDRTPSWSQANQKSPSPTDSDSGVSSRGSLEVSVDEPIAEPPKKSPILSQPKTIRFPAVPHQKTKDNGAEPGGGGKSTPHVNGGGRCRWNECAAQFDTSGALLEHLQVKHVISQSHANQEQYVCLWRGCKVHGRTSCSISWLERHVLAHAGTKPFRCIVDGCGQRFNSQLMLERHVNNHFNGDGGQSAATKKLENGGNVKLFKRNGRIIRFRRQPWSARMFDFIDSGIMEGLQHKLVCMTQARTLGRVGVAGHVVTLQGQILARRTDLKGNKELLVRWHPNDVVADEWIAETDYESTRTLSILSMSAQSRDALSPALFPASVTSPGRKHRRKPLTTTT